MRSNEISSQKLAKSLSLKDKALLIIKTALINGDIKEEVIYSVPNLAQQLGISSTPVREAILELVKDGLLTSVPNKGFKLLKYDDNKLSQITEIRVLLEVRVSVEIAKNIKKSDLDILRKYAQDTLEYAQEDKLIEFLQADREFHIHFLGLANNPFLVEITENLRDRARMSVLQFLIKSGRLRQAAQEHISIVDALEKKDLANVAKFVEGHINLTIEALNDARLVIRAAH